MHATPLSIADFERYAHPNEPQLSADGARLVVVVARPDLESNGWAQELLTIDVTTGRTHALSPIPPRIRSPRWSPSGEQIAVLAADAAGTPQVWLLDPLRQVTRAPRGVLQFAWSPRGDCLAYITEESPEPREGVERHNRSFEVGGSSYLARGAPLRAQLWRTSLDGEAVPLTSGSPSLSTALPMPGDVRSFDWSPDGSSIVFLSQPEPHVRDMFRLSLESIDVSLRQRRVLVSGPRALANPRWSADGRWIAFQAPTGPEPLFTPQGLFVVSPSGEDERHVSSSLDRDLSGAWLPDGRALVARGFDGPRVALWRVPLQGEPEEISLGEVDPISSVSVSQDGTFAFVGVQPTRPAEVWVVRPGQPARAVTALHAAWTSRRLGAVHIVRWPGPDGTELDGVLVTPPDYDPQRRYPLVLSLHAGPMVTSTRGYSDLHQQLAARGWLVFCPNYRGSNHAGQQFQRAIVGDPGDGPGRDVMSGVEALRARGILDETRLAVTGWSYGGFMTTWLCARYPIWRAAVAGAPVTDWFDYYSLSDLNTWSSTHLGGGSPWGDRAATWWAQSPLAHAHAIRTPTLILACTGDERVPITHAYKLFHALEDNGVPVRFVAYPVSGHSPADPVHQRDVRRRWIEWLAEHLA